MIRPGTAARKLRDDSIWEIEVWREYLNGQPLGWRAWFPPFDILAQGGSAEEAVTNLRAMMTRWVTAIATKAEALRGPDRHWRTEAEED